MPRINKKTRTKGLPPKLQLQQKDAATGSYPSNVRIVSDNRTGAYLVKYDDLNTIGFGERSNLLENIASYWRFNSGSSYGEVLQTDASPPSGAYRISPTYINTAVQNSNTDKSLEYVVQLPPSFVNFTNPPFSGTTDDPNATSLYFYPPDQAQLTGSLELFNPGVNPVISGSSTEKAFTVCFWARFLSDAPSTNTFQTLFAVAKPTATNSSGSMNDGVLSIIRTDTGASNEVRILIYDDNSNGIGKATNSVQLSDSAWYHFAFTYDGSKEFDGFKIYINGSEEPNTVNLFTGTLGDYTGMSSSLGVDKIYIGKLTNELETSFDGLFDELLLVNKSLSASEVKEVYRYNRTISRPNEFNPFIGVWYGTNIDTSNRFIKIPTEQTTSLFGKGVIRKGIGDNIASFTPGQDLQPFRDHFQPASYQKGLSNNQFWATGSAVDVIGEGFDQPLWSKTKLEIDITPRTQCSFGVRASGSLTDPAQQDSHFMAYWNNDEKLWEGIGNGAPLNKYEGHSATSRPTLFTMFDEVCNGFGASMDTGGFSTSLTASSTIIGNPINNFGFPYDNKYKATSSNLIRMSDFINEPFLVEKIVLYVSATLDLRDCGEVGGTSVFTQPCITSFFLLNQRNSTPPKRKTKILWASGSTSVSTLLTQSFTGDSSRDLISWVQFSKRVNTGPTSYRAGFARDVNYITINDRVHFNQQFYLYHKRYL
jgi:hypothetical protein